MKFAIAVPYAMEQNEPSKPLPRLITVNPDQAVFHAELRRLFLEHMGVDCDPDDLEIVDMKASNEYGDIAVSWEDTLYLYLTYVEQYKR